MSLHSAAEFTQHRRVCQKPQFSHRRRVYPPSKIAYNPLKKIKKRWEKGVDERESGGGSLKSVEGLPLWMHISIQALGWGLSHLPCILALHYSLWPWSPPSLALVPAIWVIILPFRGHFLLVLSPVNWYRLRVRFSRHLYKMFHPLDPSHWSQIHHCYLLTRPPWYFLSLKWLVLERENHSWGYKCIKMDFWWQ